MSFPNRFFLLVCGALYASFCAALCALGLTACDSSALFGRLDDSRLVLMTWNTQTFFDAIDDGSEFSEFSLAKGQWTEEKYKARLDRLRAAVLRCGATAGMGTDRGPDILILEEIENQRVIRDLCNRLPSRSIYPYAVFVPPEAGIAFGTAVLSRYPVESATAHTVVWPETALRPLLEVDIRLGGSVLTVFAAHWKSKSGEEDSVSIRSAQERLLYDRLSALESRRPGAEYIACGDFNQTIDEFALLGRYRNAWPEWLAALETGRLTGPAGSYCYNGQWETIDSFFYGDTLADGQGWEAGAFRVQFEPPFLDDEGQPFRYNLWNGSGYSDHLPLLLELKRVN